MAIDRVVFRLLVSCLLCMAMSSCAENTHISKENNRSGNARSQIIPADPLFRQQYYFTSMEVLKAWRFTKGDPNCLIGIIERDMDVSHPDYAGNIQGVHRLDGMNYNTYDRFVVHGTRVTGLIAAQKNNGLGVAGLAPECKVIPALYGMPPANGLSKKEYMAQFEVIMLEKIETLIRYLVDKGCKVINCSFNLGSFPASIFNYAIKNDVVIVLASGNNTKWKLSYQKLPDDILVVGGINRKNRRWREWLSYIGRKREESNYGDFLDVVAPIEGLLLCHPTNVKYKGKRRSLVKFSNTTGTSYAAPMATSLVALIRSLRPDLDAKTVVEIVKQGADDLGEEGWDIYTGYGRLNFYKSLNLASSWPKH